MNATTDALWLAVEQHPLEWERYLILADALEDADAPDSEVFLCRWAAKYRRSPHHRETYAIPTADGWRKIPDKYSWAWYSDVIDPNPHRFDPHPTREARLPRDVFIAFRRGYDHAYYPSFRKALDGLQDALQRLRSILDVTPMKEEKRS